MVNQAGRTIASRPIQTMEELNRVYLLVGSTLICTILLTILIANYLLESITKPIDSLLESSRRIEEGQWGYQTGFRTSGGSGLHVIWCEASVMA